MTLYLRYTETLSHFNVSEIGRRLNNHCWLDGIYICFCLCQSPREVTNLRHSWKSLLNGFMYHIYSMNLLWKLVDWCLCFKPQEISFSTYSAKIECANYIAYLFSIIDLKNFSFMRGPPIGLLLVFLSFLVAHKIAYNNW